MLDIKFIRENADLIAAGAKKKHLTVDINKLLAVDEKRRVLLTETETMRAKQNAVSDQVVKASADEKARLIAEMKTLKEAFSAKEKKLQEVEHDWQLLMVSVPNIPDLSVPEGTSDADNVEVRTWGEKPAIKNPKSHVDLMQALGIADFERGTKVAGFRGYVLKGDGALLNYAVWNFVQDHFVKKGGF